MIFSVINSITPGQLSRTDDHAFHGLDVVHYAPFSRRDVYTRGGQPLSAPDGYGVLETVVVKPKFEERKETMLAYIEHQGPYDDIPWGDLMQELYGWAKDQKVMPGFHPMGLYYDDPQRVPREKCRSDIAITFKGEGKPSGTVLTRRLPAMMVATVSFKGPGSDLGKAYLQLSEYIRDKGHRVVGPSIEIYSKKPEIVDGVIILYSKIMTPVQPIQ